MPAAASRTQQGLFIVHQDGRRLLFEIPRRELNRDMIIARRSIAGGGRGNVRFCRWERVGSRIVLREQDRDYAFDSAFPPARSIERVRYPPFMLAFDIEAFGADSAVIIDVTRLFTTGVPEFAGVSGVQGDRTWIERVVASPDNINVVALQTGVVTDPNSPNAGGAHTARMHWNILRLPETPMMPRLFDPRVDVYNISARAFGAVDRHRPSREYERRYVERFRLEKRDPQAAVSEPVQPIVFWIDPSTPPWLVPYVKAGVAEWLLAFEDAGFRNAIVAREAPSPADDPDWSMADIRHSVIYWNYATADDAPHGGPEVVDPRSGEIIRGTVNIPQSYIDRMLYRYFVHSGVLDARTQFVPNAPDSLVGRLIENLIAHEVGHAIGMPQYAAWSEYPIDSLRSAAFLGRVGRHVPTIMGLQYNYIAQPEDSVPPELLVAVVGPYDRDAVMWQEKPIPGARTPEEELPTLDAWIRARDAIPWRRFKARDGMRGAEAVSSYEDGVRTSALGLKNLEREMSMVQAMADRPDADGASLRALYDEALRQWLLYMEFAVRMVGGVRDQSAFGTTPSTRPLPGARQREAVRFITQHALHTPTCFVRPTVLRRLALRDDVVTLIRKLQTVVLANLFDDTHLDRLADQEALATSNDRYTLAGFFSDIRRGVWDELAAPHPRIDVYRRNVQRAYLDVVKERIEPPAPASPAASVTSLAGDRYVLPAQAGGDVRLILLRELAELGQQVEAAMPRAADSATRWHLQDMRARIRAMVPSAR